MMNIFNQPSEETQERIARALEAMSATRPQEDFSGSPGSKYIIRGDKVSGFYGFVQPSEFGKIEIEELETATDFDGVNLALAVGISAGEPQFTDTPWIKVSIDGRPCFIPLKSLRHSVAWDAIYNAGAVYGTRDEGLLPPTGRLGTDLVINGEDNSINTTKLNFLGNKSDEMNYADTVGKVGDTLVLKGWSNGANYGEVTIESITNTKIIVSGKQLVSENGGKSSRFYEKTKAVTQNKTVKIGGLEYEVTLIKGSGNNPTDSANNPDGGSTGAGNEWNRVILPLHEQAKLGNWAYPQYAKNKDGGAIEDWGVGLSDKDMQLHHAFGTGYRPWCQEVVDTVPWRRVSRGYNGASNSYWGGSWGAYSYHGWLPVLRLK